MAHIKTRNVNTAFATLVRMIHHGELPLQTVPSRVGEVIQVTEPVILSYYQPRERVLFNKARDCNCFFHLFESLWMLAGRNDVAPLDYYSSGIAKIASDDGKTFNGAYGHRWRHAPVAVEYKVGKSLGPGMDLPVESLTIPLKTVSRFETMVSASAMVDQLKILIEHLKKKPGSRRAVLNMWNVEDDLMNIDSSIDVCCNLNCVFEVEQSDESAGQPRYLNMTVFNRSNDLIWGMLGANVVHFSFLQEYVASHLGLDVGTYNQITSNLHVYTERWKPVEWLEAIEEGQWKEATPYDDTDYKPLPLVLDPVQFDKEVVEFIDNQERPCKEPFLRDVAADMCLAFREHKERNYERALEAIARVQDEAWRVVGHDWIMKRKSNYERKQNGKATSSHSEDES